MPWLEIAAGRRRVRLRISDAGLGVGRDPRFELSPDHPDLAPHHFDIVRAGGVWLLRAVDGRVTVGGRVAEERPLVDGDEIGFGPYRAVFVASVAAKRSSGTTRLGPLDGAPRPVRTLAFAPEPGALTQTMRITGAAFVIGADPGCDLVLAAPGVSRRHARLTRRDDGTTVLEDLDSTNGVYLGTERIFSAPLRPGAGFRLGETHFVFNAADDIDERREAAGDGPRGRLGLVGSSPAVVAVRDAVRRFAARPEPVLITGETGTGKDLVAQALHRLSSRAAGPFVAVNAAAIPADTAEAELFGHRKGAFTGADRDRAGAFAQSRSGTLFLDEIGDIAPALQAKLLRVIREDGGPAAVRPVGADTEQVHDVRIVAATNRDVFAVGEGFRLDLAHRLGTLHIHVPPLRERPGDIPELVRHFAASSGTPVVFSDEAAARLMAHTWPGNVRELRATVVRTLVSRPEAAEYGRVEADDLRFAPVAAGAGRPPAVGAAPVESLADLEIVAIRRALEAAGGNRAAAARALGIGKSTLYEKLKRMGL